MKISLYYLNNDFIFCAIIHRETVESNKPLHQQRKHALFLFYLNINTLVIQVVITENFFFIYS